LDIQRVEVSIIKAGDITNQMVSHSAASHWFMGTSLQEPLSISDLPHVKLGCKRIRPSANRSDDKKDL
jgi:hypothetical protein